MLFFLTCLLNQAPLKYYLPRRSFKRQKNDSSPSVYCSDMSFPKCLIDPLYDAIHQQTAFDQEGGVPKGLIPLKEPTPPSNNLALTQPSNSDSSVEVDRAAEYVCQNSNVEKEEVEADESKPKAIDGAKRDGSEEV